jgi:hypothetical protein
MSLVRPVCQVVTFRIERTQQRITSLQLPTRRILRGGWQWQCHIMRYSSRSVAIALAIQNVATADSARGDSPSLLERGGWTPSKRVSVNRPSLCTFSLQTGIVFFGPTQPSEQHTLQIGWRFASTMAAVESFALRLPIANAISCRDLRIPADNAARSSIRQIVAQTMQDGAAYQLSEEQGNRGFVSVQCPRRCNILRKIWVS